MTAILGSVAAASVLIAALLHFATDGRMFNHIPAVTLLVATSSVPRFRSSGSSCSQCQA